MAEIMSGMSSCSDSTNKASSLCSSSEKILKSAVTLNVGTTKSTKEILNDVFEWKLISQYSEATPSMVYGVVHLIRLLVKLPKFLDVSPMSDEKLQILLTFLDSVAEFLETHDELYKDLHYTATSSSSSSGKSTTIEGPESEQTPPRKRVARDK